MERPREKTILPEQVKEQMKTHAERRWHWWYAGVAAALALFPAVWSAGNFYGPVIEGQVIQSMTVLPRVCDGASLVVDITVKKASTARFSGLTVYREDPEGLESARILRWVSLADQHTGPSAGLPVGIPVHVGPVLIEHGCGRLLSFQTRHDSTWGWWEIDSKFGPFGPYGDANVLSTR